MSKNEKKKGGKAQTGVSVLETAAEAVEGVEAGMPVGAVGGLPEG